MWLCVCVCVEGPASADAGYGSCPAFAPLARLHTVPRICWRTHSCPLHAAGGRDTGHIPLPDSIHRSAPTCLVKAVRNASCSGLPSPADTAGPSCLSRPVLTAPFSSCKGKARQGSAYKREALKIGVDNGQPRLSSASGAEADHKTVPAQLQAMAAGAADAGWRTFGSAAATAACNAGATLAATPAASPSAMPASSPLTASCSFAGRSQLRVVEIAVSRRSMLARSSARTAARSASTCEGCVVAVGVGRGGTRVRWYKTATSVRQLMGTQLSCGCMWVGWQPPCLRLHGALPCPGRQSSPPQPAQAPAPAISAHAPAASGSPSPPPAAARWPAAAPPSPSSWP